MTYGGAMKISRYMEKAFTARERSNKYGNGKASMYYWVTFETINVNFDHHRCKNKINTNV